MPKISVIIPAYNHEKYISATLESILNQSMSDFEIVAVDDGSPDNTGAILDEYAKKDARVRVYHQHNQGVAAALNAGIHYANGEWIAFCGSDDTLPPRALAFLFAKSNDVDVVIGEYSCISDSGSMVNVHYSRNQRTFMSYMFRSGAMWGKLLRREFLIQNDITFRDLTMEEDVVYICEIAVRKPRFSVVKRSTYFYWNHDHGNQPSLTHRNDLLSFKERYRGKQMMLDILREANFAKEWKEHFLSNAVILSDYVLCIPDSAQRAQAFELLKAFLLQYDWSGQEDTFAGYFNMTLEEIRAGTAEQYFARNVSFDLKERVYQKFLTGQIGFKYILNYANAWAKFKILSKSKYK